MDHFGIGAAIQSMVRVYIQSARATGRTTSLVESVKDGDRIVFSNPVEADRVHRLCLERGVKVECIVVQPREPARLFERGTSQGRTLLDHTWVEQYYQRCLDQAQREIDYFERQSSGEGEAHRETRRRAIEIVKWPPI